jgi:hypothetical protein
MEAAEALINAFSYNMESLVVINRDHEAAEICRTLPY